VITRTFDALQERDFLVFWLGMLGSFMALQMQQIARGYLAYELTGSATALGVVTLAWGLPQLVWSPIAGVAADRLPRRELLIVTQSCMAAGMLVNAVLISTGVIAFWHLVVLSFVVATAFTFNIPARQALTYSLVGRERVANAVALNNTGMNLTRIAGPALAGVLIGIPAIGTAGTFYVMAVAYFTTVVVLFWLPATPGQKGQGRGAWSEMLDGLRYIQDSPPMRSILLTAVAVILLGMPHHTLLPLFALDVFQAGPEGLGLLGAMAGVGAVVGSLAVAYFSGSPRTRQVQLLAGLTFGLALAAFAVSPWFPLALAAMFGVGAAGNTYLSLNNTFMLTNSEPGMHGRLSSAYNMIWGSLPLTTLPMSVAADAVGAPITVAVAGVLAALAVLALNGRAMAAMARGERVSVP